jgi:ribosomal protein S18 acetylase RimI-like enzyme
MRIRSPLPEDRAALEALVAPPPSADPSPFRPEEISCALELLGAVLDPPEGNTYEALVLCDDAADAPMGRPVAYACFGATPMTDATFDLYWMITDAERRGQGLGSTLLSAVEETLTARRARTLRIETSSLEGQGGARRFYERAGYRVVGLIADFYRPGDDLVTLAKRLA